jgi:hypothetical protein
MRTHIVVARRTSCQRRHDEAGQRQYPKIDHLIVSLQLDALIAGSADQEKHLILVRLGNRRTVAGVFLIEQYCNSKTFKVFRVLLLAAIWQEPAAGKGT